MNAVKTPAEPKKKRILIIEDDADIRNSLVELLVDQEYTIAAVANGQEGMDALRAGPLPDLILLDLMMPVKDGFVFRTEQLADTRFCKIPVVVMTADGNAKHRYTQITCDVFLKKPLELDEFLEVIAQQLAKAKT